jgi:hypothetical protein
MGPKKPGSSGGSGSKGSSMSSLMSHIGPFCGSLQFVVEGRDDPLWYCMSILNVHILPSRRGCGR